MRRLPRCLEVLSAILAVGAVLALTAPAALAHPQHGATGGLLGGLLHPLLGWDHLLAMVAVGLWAAQRGGRERWRLPLGFVVAMAAGVMLGWVGLPLPGAETAVALSVLALGALIVATPLLGAGFALALVLAAGVLHGHVHGAALAETAAPALFAVGALGATAALHALGVTAGAGLLTLRGRMGGTVLRGTGMAIACLGLVLLVAGTP